MRGSAKVGFRSFESALLAVGLTAMVAAPVRAAPVAEAPPEVVRIDGPVAGLKLGLMHYPAPRHGVPTLLVLHGQAVPHEANMGYPFGGRSMLRTLADTGLDTWALDYYGFGVSDRYPEMNDPPGAHTPLGQLSEVTDQVASAVAYLRARNGGQAIMLMGDSRGTEVAGAYAARQPGTLSRLVLFGPVTPFMDGSAPPHLPAYSFVTPKDLWVLFSGWADRNPGADTIDQRMYVAWATRLLETDPTSRTRNPPSIKIPAGGAADATVLMHGRFIYDPSKIDVPTLLVMGETDEIATFAGAQWLLGQLRNAPHRRLVVIGNGSHTVQFERERSQLYQAVAEFLHEP